MLLVTGQAETLEFSSTQQWEVRSPSVVLQIPDHIRLTSGNPERHWKVPPVNRREVFRRDNHTCQYCGSTKHLTLEHIIPRSKGGTHTWDNVVTACKSVIPARAIASCMKPEWYSKPNPKHRCILRSPLLSSFGKNSSLLTPDLKPERRQD